MVGSFSVLYYAITCDRCGKYECVKADKDSGIYNGAQAVRSLHWSFGRNKKVSCCSCRQEILRGFIK